MEPTAKASDFEGWQHFDWHHASTKGQCMQHGYS
jgi:hypothetical protein